MSCTFLWQPPKFGSVKTSNPSSLFLIDRQGHNEEIKWEVHCKKVILTLLAPCIFKSCIKIKINLNFYFHTSLWYLKRFYEDLKGTTKKCENKNFKLIFSISPESER